MDLQEPPSAFYPVFSMPSLWTEPCWDLNNFCSLHVCPTLNRDSILSFGHQEAPDWWSPSSLYNCFQTQMNGFRAQVWILAVVSNMTMSKCSQAQRSQNTLSTGVNIWWNFKQIWVGSWYYSSVSHKKNPLSFGDRVLKYSYVNCGTKNCFLTQAQWWADWVLI